MRKPCLDCGQVTETGSRCPDCQRARWSEENATTRAHLSAGYDRAWRRLSKRAREMQTFCTDCLTTTDLTADHSEEAWRRHDRGLPIRIEDIDVVCRTCNAKRGRSREHDGKG